MLRTARRTTILALCLGLAACGGAAGGGELTPAERGRADAAWREIARHCTQVAATTVRVHGGLDTPAERRAHVAERRAVRTLLALHREKPQAGYAPPGARIRPLSDVLGDLSKRLLFCDSVAAAEISLALDRQT